MHLRDGSRGWSPTAILLCAYAFAIVALPTNVGIDTAFMVLTPARMILVLGILAAAREALPERRTAAVLPGLWLTIGWLLVLVLAAATTARAPDHPGIARLGSMALEGAGVFWLGWWVTRRSPTRIQAALVGVTAVVAAAATAMALVGLQYQAVLFGSGDLVGLRFGLVRQEASFDAPLFYAAWLVAAGALAFGLAMTVRGRVQWMAWLAWVLIALGVVTTASRFGLTAVPGVLGLALLALRRPAPGLGALAVASILAVVFFTGPGGGLDDTALTPEPIPSVIPSTPGSPGSSEVPPVISPSPAMPSPTLTPEMREAELLRGSTSARMEALRATVDAVRRRPVLGWGLLSAKRVVADELGHPNFVDDAYLVILIELGIAGLAAFFVLVGGVFRRILPFRSPLGASQVIALVVLLAFGVVAANLATSQGYALFWLVAALATGTATRERTNGLPWA